MEKPDGGRKPGTEHDQIMRVRAGFHIFLISKTPKYDDALVQDSSVSHKLMLLYQALYERWN